MRTTIQTYNAVHKVPERIDRGYHETITQAFMRLIHRQMQQCSCASFEQFCEANADLLDRQILLRFYSRDRLMSAEAKREFVEPDLMPFSSVASSEVEHCRIAGLQGAVLIRPELPADVARIRAITAASFSASALGHNGEADLIEQLRMSCTQFVSLVAEVDGQAVGHVLFTPATIESDGGLSQGMGLGPISVLPGFQKKGIGTRLITSGLSQLQGASPAFVIVLGDPHFYGRFGFVPAHRFGITCEFGTAPLDPFQILWLNHSVTPQPPGTAKYHPAFSEPAKCELGTH